MPRRKHGECTCRCHLTGMTGALGPCGWCRDLHRPKKESATIAKRPGLAQHFKEGHKRVAPGLYNLADLRKFHSYLHRAYECDHLHVIGPGGQRVVHDADTPAQKGHSTDELL